MITFAIGDVHGWTERLTNLIRSCESYARLKYAGQELRWIFLGDYVDRGPDSKGTVEFLKNFTLTNRAICLLGNHDDLLLAGFEQWTQVYCGGTETYESYGGRLPDDHRDFLASLPTFLNELHDTRRFYVHAGIRRNVPLDRQYHNDLLWIREPFLNDDTPGDPYVVHGHTPVPGNFPQVRHNRVNCDSGVFCGGFLSAAVFEDGLVMPVAVVNDAGYSGTINRGG